MDLNIVRFVISAAPWSRSPRTRPRLAPRRDHGRVIALGVVVALAFACGLPDDWAELKTEIRDRFPRAPQMTVDELAERLGNGTQPPLIVDVREPGEYAVSHIEGAIHARGERLERLLEERAPGREAVLYCSVGYRSSRETQRLVDAGFGDVSNLEGSIFEWANSGRAVVRDGEPVDEVHSFDEDWGRLLEESLRTLPESE